MYCYHNIRQPSSKALISTVDDRWYSFHNNHYFCLYLWQYEPLELQALFDNKLRLVPHQQLYRSADSHRIMDSGLLQKVTHCRSDLSLWLGKLPHNHLQWRLPLFLLCCPAVSRYQCLGRTSKIPLFCCSLANFVRKVFRCLLQLQVNYPPSCNRSMVHHPLWMSAKPPNRKGNELFQEQPLSFVVEI